MTSAKRIEANRKNAQKSTGPKTDEGKANSAMNALKHGLTSRDAVLPHEDPAAFEHRLAAWHDYYPTNDPAQLALIDLAVTASWRLNRCTRVETAKLAERVRHAEADFVLGDEIRAEEVGRRLIYEPICRGEDCQFRDPIVAEKLARRAADDPPVLARQLRSFAAGVDWLLDRWRELARLLNEDGYWHYSDRFRAVRLLGKRPEDVIEDPAAADLALACHVLHPVPWGFWEECYQGRLGVEGKPMYIGQVEAIATRMPKDEEEALDLIWRVIDAETDRLEALKPLRDAVAAADRAGAADRAMFDDGPSGALLRRYETACERELHRSIADLRKLRKEDERRGAEPAAPAPSAPDEIAPAAPRNEANAKPVEAPVRGSKSPRRGRKPAAKAPAVAASAPPGVV
jgi:hypothetical protein